MCMLIDTHLIWNLTSVTHNHHCCHHSFCSFVARDRHRSVKTRRPSKSPTSLFNRLRGVFLAITFSLEYRHARTQTCTQMRIKISLKKMLGAWYTWGRWIYPTLTCRKMIHQFSHNLFANSVSDAKCVLANEITSTASFSVAIFSFIKRFLHQTFPKYPAPY